MYARQADLAPMAGVSLVAVPPGTQMQRSQVPAAGRAAGGRAQQSSRSSMQRGGAASASASAPQLSTTMMMRSSRRKRRRTRGRALAATGGQHADPVWRGQKRTCGVCCVQATDIQPCITPSWGPITGCWHLCAARNNAHDIRSHELELAGVLKHLLYVAIHADQCSWGCAAGMPGARLRSSG